MLGFDYGFEGFLKNFCNFFLQMDNRIFENVRSILDCFREQCRVADKFF